MYVHEFVYVSVYVNEWVKLMLAKCLILLAYRTTSESSDYVQYRVLKKQFNLKHLFFVFFRDYILAKFFILSYSTNSESTE